MATINGTAGDDTLFGTDDADIINGLDGNDTIDGGLGADTLNGGAGDDTFRFSSLRSSTVDYGRGLIDGGSGYDTIDFSSIFPTSLSIIRNSAGQSVLGGRVGSQDFEIKNVERINLSSQNDFVTVTSSDYVTGLEVHMGAGADYASVYGGNTVFADEGDDRVAIAALGGIGKVDGGSGIDTLVSIGFSTVDLAKGAADARFSISNFENLEVSLLGGIVTGLGDDNANVMKPSSTTTDYGSLIFDGRGGNDTITGSNNADQLSGGSGDDHIDGSAGNDIIFGDSGNDVLIGGAGNDTIDGGSGFDRASYTGLYQSYAPSVSGAGILTLHGSASEGTDTLTNVEAITFKDGVFQADPDAAYAQVLRVFDTVLGRAPDPLGLDFYVDQMEDKGVSLDAVANEFVQSKEFQTATGGFSNAAFVDYVFEHALHRSPDATGKAYYTQALDNGFSRGAFVVQLSESAEHRSLTSDQVAKGFYDTDDTYQAVALLYDGFANRLPDASGLIYYAERVKAGTMTLAQVTNDFATSAEFKNAIAGKDNGQIVDFIYQNTLDRAPDAVGRAFYKDQLDHGATAAGILQDVALSQEHYNLVSSHIINGIDVIG